jgi:hypothetical protein
LILCYRNTCLPSTVSTTKFPGAPRSLLFPIARLPSSVAHGGGSGCCCGCGLWPWPWSWCPERSCVGPACVSPPHRRSAHQPPHEQLLVRLGVGGVSPVDIVSSGGPWSVIVASTHHPPHEQVLVRLEGRGSSGPWCRGPRGYGDVSDVARVEGSGGTYRAGIPLHGSPGIPLTLLVPVHGLTSRFDGEEGFAQPSSGVGSLVVVLPVPRP